MSDKACFSSKNCKVKAYYVKEGKIFYIDSMRPESNVCDKSIILHELVHHYQKNSGKKIDLDEKTLWTLQERQALYYQNLFFNFEKRKIIIKDQKMFYNVKADRGLIFSINIMNSIDEYKQFKVFKKLTFKTI